ncbi:nuclear transport factor 2 family protein [Novosphingobium album (ex Hu et al. 2023)]|uniref:Nuclear transport factor 2 family protein n=1 Tax=Novosphingobium album (ex Hu et al. 2023) TaxID=2930093 RepID=A0ABT0AWX4_9SPHN|nr:nuclear transport factor 2 family protein [Novosphingobium album (ex Hu et al. 2023)]MCJ2177150.1 nuclear transport factor 2 family protein [Novosphingobium album (ex Hu et al. 2023)]
MAEREDIIEVLNLYGFAMDTRRWDLFDRIFTLDCDVDYGPTSSWRGREQFKADFGTFHELFDATQHVMTNHLVQVDGDRASSHTYGSWRLIRYAAGDPPVWDGTGYYDDQLVRTPAGWRIAKRTCRVVFWTGNPKVQTPMEDMVFQLDLVALHTEAREERLNFLKAIA